ncbi:hypothetical protein A2765_04345 [Candidatus Kaiserbacteria bacterium RIFCSPHIGHO2_01_FULL_56_24]|uniref:Uncharacterized protein n=1 Tax=Candidatus Kaiserbacteria bacterium RIFCSPHIGHO2_01_FULL_56_24 TaxID=1798487 RepID=A0A1F6DED8_9BACT|nr:MAG: hypothetical protein A2765_04345 [Candidatus Kaiserbacteria bacterium RIFCSPHIGHO2_01_FULL_56_24]
MIATFPKAGRTLLISGLIAFLFLGFFGLSHVSMAMGEDGNMAMSNCLLMSGQAVVCNMNPLEHIAAWQSMFTSLPQQDNTAVMLLLLAALVIAFLWTRLHWPSIDDARISARSVVRREYIPLATPLQELFSNGILNPKIF